jgi:hypothetical protein
MVLLNEPLEYSACDGLCLHLCFLLQLTPSFHEGGQTF